MSPRWPEIKYIQWKTEILKSIKKNKSTSVYTTTVIFSVSLMMCTFQKWYQHWKYIMTHGYSEDNKKKKKSMLIQRKRHNS